MVTILGFQFTFASLLILFTLSPPLLAKEDDCNRTPWQTEVDARQLKAEYLECDEKHLLDPIIYVEDHGSQQGLYLTYHPLYLKFLKDFKGKEIPHIFLSYESVSFNKEKDKITLLRPRITHKKVPRLFSDQAPQENIKSYLALDYEKMKVFFKPSKSSSKKNLTFTSADHLDLLNQTKTKSVKKITLTGAPTLADFLTEQHVFENITLGELLKRLYIFPRTVKIPMQEILSSINDNTKIEDTDKMNLKKALLARELHTDSGELNLINLQYIFNDVQFADVLKGTMKDQNHLRLFLRWLLKVRKSGDKLQAEALQKSIQKAKKENIESEKQS